MNERLADMTLYGMSSDFSVSLQQQNNKKKKYATRVLFQLDCLTSKVTWGKI